MANSFSSAIAKLGIDTSGWKAGLANALNQAQEFKGKFSKMLKAGGLRGPAKFLGVGAIVYGMKEAYQLASERAQELADKQDKNIEKAFKLAEALRGTAEGAAAWSRAVNFSDKLDDDTKAVLRFQSALKNSKDTAADISASLLGSITTKSENYGRVFRYYLDRIKGVGKDEALRAARSQIVYDQNQPFEQQQNDAQLAAAHAQSQSAARMEREKSKIAKDQREAELSGGSAIEQQAYYLQEQARIQAALKNETLLKNEAAREGVSYEEKILDYLREEAQVTGKLGVLNKTRREQTQELADAQIDLANAQKGEIDFAEQLLQIDRKITEAKYNLGDDSPEAQIKYGKVLAGLLNDRTVILQHQREVSDKLRSNAAAMQAVESKNVSLVKEQLSAKREVVDAQMEYDKYFFSGTSTEEQRLAAQEKLLSAKEKEAALEKQIVDAKKEGRNLTQELADLRRSHTESVLEKLAPSDAEIKSGARGTDRQRSMESKADEDDRKAQQAYDDAARIRSKYTNRETGEFDPGMDKDQFRKDIGTYNPKTRNYAGGQYQKDLDDAQRLAGEADKLRGGAGSKEGLQSALSEQTFKDQSERIRASIDDLKKLLEPQPY